MSHAKKRTREDASPFKRKKSKVVNATNVLMDPPVEVKNDHNSDHPKAELLDAQTIREGLLLLGCVVEVKSTFLVMSLPGCLSGTVPMNNISSAFTNSLKNFAENSEMKEPSISSIVEVGMVFPCKVIQVSRDLSKRRPSIVLSIDPQDVNAELKPSSLYSKMVLFVSICSIEDHGYIVDVGSKYIQGFLSKHGSDDQSEELKIGEVIPTFVKRINISNKKSAKIQLSRLDFNQDFPEISVEDIKLHSVLPGAKIRADVIEIQHPFVYLNYHCFEACASVLSLGSTHKAIKIGSTIQGTVLYVHPITHMIYLMLNMKPSPDLYAGYFGLKKYASVENLKFQYFYKSRAYYKINRGTYGFIHSHDLPNKVSESTANHTVSKACVLVFHYMDNLVQMTAKPSMTEKNIVFPEDVQIGDIYDAVVKKHVSNGMFVQICLGLFGFVRKIHMSDVFVTKPEALFPVGSKIKCRVLTTDGKSKINLTCKESFLNIKERYILSSYESVQKGQFYKGVIVHKTDEYILVLFFNDVKGVVPSSHVPEGSIFYEGQTVLCEVLRCNPQKKLLRLSLKTEGWSSIEELEDLCDKPSKSSTYTKGNKITSSKNSMMSHDTFHKKSQKAEKGCESEMDKNISTHSDESAGTHVREYDSGKPVEAKVTKVKGNQLNILVNETKGRVHITELGCTSEDVYPLRKFSAGQKIQVYIIGKYTKRKKNYLEISHQNWISFKECSLNCTPVSLSQDLKPGNSVIGFIKEVHDVSAVLWLSPTETGVLDYLHFSDKPKVVKKLRRHLKVGLSLKVSILDNPKYSPKDKGTRSIALTKIEKSLPQAGKSILGLVQIACFEKGLILKLPFDYHGFIAVTDLTDVYIPVETLFEKYRKLKFLRCHILEVNHDTRSCQLSLRTSRMYGKKVTPETSFCPEITFDSVKEGDVLKGFVKSISDSAVTVILGRNLEGKIEIHNCKSADCGLCNSTKNIIHKHPIGNIVQVVIQKKIVGGRSCILSLTDSKIVENTKCNRLTITEDISWDEIE